MVFLTIFYDCVAASHANGAAATTDAAPDPTAANATKPNAPAAFDAGSTTITTTRVLATDTTDDPTIADRHIGAVRDPQSEPVAASAVATATSISAASFTVALDATDSHAPTDDPSDADSCGKRDFARAPDGADTEPGGFHAVADTESRSTGNTASWSYPTGWP